LTRSVSIDSGSSSMPLARAPRNRISKGYCLQLTTAPPTIFWAVLHCTECTSVIPVIGGTHRLHHLF
jgi:hypothetical protein